MYPPIGNEAQYEAYLDKKNELLQQYKVDPLFCLDQKINQLEHQICDYLMATRCIEDLTLKSMARLVVQEDIMDTLEHSSLDADDVLDMLRKLADDNRLFVSTEGLVVAGFDYKLIEAVETGDNGRPKTVFANYNRPLALPVCKYFWEEWGDQLGRYPPVLTSDEIVLSRFGKGPGCVRPFPYTVTDSTRIEKAFELA